MLRFILRRLLQMVGVVFVLSLLVFVWLRSLPGGPSRPSSASGDPRAPGGPRDGARASTSRSSCSTGKFLERAAPGRLRRLAPACCPATTRCDVFLPALPGDHRADASSRCCIAIALGIPLGYLAARRRGVARSTTSRSSARWSASRCRSSSWPSCSSTSSPSSWQLAAGLRPPGPPASTPPASPGFFVLDGILTREWDAAWDALKHLILPGRRAGHDPVRGDLPDHPGLGARRARRGLRAHRRGQGPHHPGDPRPARPAQRAAAGRHHHRPAGRRPARRARCSPRRCSPGAGSATRSADGVHAAATTPCCRC